MTCLPSKMQLTLTHESLSTTVYRFVVLWYGFVVYSRVGCVLERRNAKTLDRNTEAGS